MQFPQVEVRLYRKTDLLRINCKAPLRPACRLLFVRPCCCYTQTANPGLRPWVSFMAAVRLNFCAHLRRLVHRDACLSRAASRAFGLLGA